MNKLLRISAKLLDYFWFYASVLLLVDLFIDNDYLLLITLLCLPLCFVPIETFLIKKFRTTLGKVVFGIYYKNPLSWKQAFKVSLRKALFIQLLFIPIVNIAFLGYFVFEKSSLKKKRWDSEPFISKFPKIYFYIPLLIASFFFTLLTTVPDVVYDQIAKIAPIEKIIDRPSSSFLFPSGWVKVVSKDNTFSAFFPKEPTYEESKHSASGAPNLVFKEYTVENDQTFSLGSIDLPKKWTKWGSNLVLKGAMKVLDGKGDIQTKRKGSYHGLPSYEYKMVRDNKIILGKIILVEDTLYSLELRQDSEFSSEQKEIAQKFFNSFHPGPSEVLEPIKEEIVQEAALVKEDVVKEELVKEELAAE